MNCIKDTLLCLSTANFSGFDRVWSYNYLSIQHYSAVLHTGSCSLLTMNQVDHETHVFGCRAHPQGPFFLSSESGDQILSAGMEKMPMSLCTVTWQSHWQACDRLVDCLHNAKEKEWQHVLFFCFLFYFVLNRGSLTLDLGFYDTSTSCHSAD